MPKDDDKKKKPEEDEEEDDSDILEGFDDADQADIRKAAAARHLAMRRWNREQAKKSKPPEKKKSGWSL